VRTGASSFATFSNAASASRDASSASSHGAWQCVPSTVEAMAALLDSPKVWKDSSASVHKRFASKKRPSLKNTSARYKSIKEGQARFFSLRKISRASEKSFRASKACPLLTCCHRRKGRTLHFHNHAQLVKAFIALLREFPSF